MSSPAEAGPARPGRDVARDDLLGYLSRNTLDADYALVAARRTGGPGGRLAGAGTALVLAVFVVLVVTLFTQTSQDADSVDNERSQLVGQVSDQQSALAQRRAEVVRLQAATSRLREQYLSGTGAAVIGRTERLGLLAGTVAAKGPGVVVEVDDAPDATDARNRVLDSDMQTLVNGLWQAGAEAISINGQRLTSLSSIRQAGEAINVNFVGLTAPYRLEVIGDRDTLPGRFAETTSGGTWFDLQQRVGLRYLMTERASLTLPAAEPAPLRFATEADKGDDS